MDFGGGAPPPKDRDRLMTTTYNRTLTTRVTREYSKTPAELPSSVAPQYPLPFVALAMASDEEFQGDYGDEQGKTESGEWSVVPPRGSTGSADIGTIEDVEDKPEEPVKKESSRRTRTRSQSKDGKD